MALLRQCLRELREERHEWEVADGAWPDANSDHEDTLSKQQRFDRTDAWPAQRIIHGVPFTHWVLKVVNGTPEFYCDGKKAKSD